MKKSAAGCRAASWFGLVLVLLLGAMGCSKEEPQEGGNKPGVTGKGFSFNCGDKTVKVKTGDPTQFATPEAVYVCEKDIVTWDPADDVQTFEVEFKKDYPFEGNAKKFHKGDGKSPQTKHQKPGLTVYEYKITVNGQSYDPQVVGGGGTP